MKPKEHEIIKTGRYQRSLFKCSELHNVRQISTVHIVAFHVVNYLFIEGLIKEGEYLHFHHRVVIILVVVVFFIDLMCSMAVLCDITTASITSSASYQRT